MVGHFTAKFRLFSRILPSLTFPLYRRLLCACALLRSPPLCRALLRTAKFPLRLRRACANQPFFALYLTFTHLRLRTRVCSCLFSWLAFGRDGVPGGKPQNGVTVLAFVT
jgi:hypothetical protein